MSLIKLAASEIKLQPHQEDAVKRFDKSDSQIYFHGLGSGKTLSAISLGQKTPGSKLVLTPASLQHNFKKELHKFNVPENDYHVVSYEKFRKHPNEIIEKYKPELVIADEFHRTKDPGSLLSETLREQRPKFKKMLGLTGSLAQNDPAEIAELMHTATGKPLLGNKKEFRETFIQNKIVKPSLFRRILGAKPGVVEVPKNLKLFKNIASQNIHTFAGDEEYRKHIPQVKEEVRSVLMSKNQQKSYDFAFNKLPYWAKMKVRANLPPSKQESVNLNAFLLGSRQASNISLTDQSSSKIDAIIKDIQEGTKSNKNFKSVVYSNFLDSGITPLSKRLTELKIPHGTFTGEQNNIDRNQMVHDYNKGKLKTLLLSSAGSEGLDLKNTSLAAIMEPSWNPERVRQTIGRTARYKSHESLPESERNVRVIHYLSEPRLGLLGKIKKIFKPQTHALGVDNYIAERSKEKEMLNKQFTDVLKAN